MYNSHTAGAATFVTVTNPHIQGQKDNDCGRLMPRRSQQIKANCRLKESKPLTQILQASEAMLEGCNTIPQRNYIIRHFVNEKKMLPRVLLWDF